MNNRTIAVYGRQSVDKKDSISIESQIEFCQYELKGDSYRAYTDKGYSGKNTDRPKFQELVRDIERGLVSKVVVYKLDRISRSIIDFAGMMEMFGKYHVEFTSATEKFDTSTPMGRAMLNICIVFAQLERETIQRRVQDAYYSRLQKGFHVSGYAPYGYQLIPTVIDGIRTKMMTPDPEAAEMVKLMFEIYAQPKASLGDIARYFTENGLKYNGKEVRRCSLAFILKNPVYAQADIDVYEFFKSQGAVIANDAEDFTGMNSCYLYQGRDVVRSKSATLKDQILVLAPHEGLVSSETWLACRRKLLGNSCITPGSRKAKNSWLTGKIKCARCGYALYSKPSESGIYYFRCRQRLNTRSCEGCGALRVADVEDFLYREMCRKMADFQTLAGGNAAKANPKLTALTVSLAKVEAEIEKLLDTLTGASKTLLAYANTKIEGLDAERQTLMKDIADLNTTGVSPERMNSIAAHLNDWDNVSFDDKLAVAGYLIAVVRAVSDNIQVEWSI